MKDLGWSAGHGVGRAFTYNDTESGMRKLSAEESRLVCGVGA